VNYSKRQEQYYKKAYKEICGELNRFYAAVEDGTVSRTQLWNYLRYQDLLDTISSNCSSIGMNQINLMDEASSKIFEETIGRSLEDMGKGNLFKQVNNETLMNQVLNSEWSGKSYSKRIWNNTNRLATNLGKEIQSMIAIGKSPTEIKKQIAANFNTSYSTADRLIRTESSYIYNAAAIESYKQADVKEIQYLAEEDACEECLSYKDKIFTIG
jgi:SPP1 gp7 family putative phage head morphogenesis protein